MSASSTAVNVLIVGSTGNTGLPATKTLSKLAAAHSHDSSNPFRMNILAQSRDSKSPAAQEILGLGNVQLIEKNWLEMDEHWLKEHRIDRVYIASHNYPSHFTDESLFLLACKQAGVKFLVRLSTMIHYLKSDTPVYYGRNHWAIENLLQQKEFNTLNWTSLRANYWGSAYLSSLAPLKDKSVNRVRVPFDEHNSVAVVDPAEVGIVAAKILSTPNPSRYYGKTYNLSGAEDTNGKKVKEITEQFLGKNIEFEYRSVAWLQELFTGMNYPQYLMKSLCTSFTGYFMTGIARLDNSKSSPELLELLGAPQKSLVQMIKEQLL